MFENKSLPFVKGKVWKGFRRLIFTEIFCFSTIATQSRWMGEDVERSETDEGINGLQPDAANAGAGDPE